MSKPTVVIFMVEAPSVRCTQRPELGTSMPSGVVHRIRFVTLAPQRAISHPERARHLGPPPSPPEGLASCQEENALDKYIFS